VADADHRAVSAVVGKVLELGVMVLFVAGLTAALFGGVVPDYRAAAGDAVGDRTLAATAERVEASVPPGAVAARRVVAVDLPPTIRGASYRVRAVNGSLVLDHPHPAVGGRTRLAIPGNATVEGGWESGADAVVVATRTDGTVRLRLTERGAATRAGERT